MKNYSILYKSILDNYNPKNYESDFLVAKIQNITCLISSDLNKQEVLQLAKVTSKFIKKNYFDGTLILFGWNDKLMKVFLNYLNSTTHYSKFEIKINLTRTTKIACLSKLVELDINKVMFICPSYEKQLISSYLNHFNYNKQIYLCVKTNIIKSITNSYRNFKILQAK